MELKVEYIPISELKMYDNNAKIHTDEQIEQIKKSIEQFGMNDPIAVWKNNEIIEGHGRLIACTELGIETVPVIRLDELTDEQRKAYMLVHNKLTMNTGFDFDILEKELESISAIDMSDFGFDDMDIEESSDVKEIVEDDYSEDVPPRTQKGQIWILGNHRLICGDSTVPNTFETLMDGVCADISFTSPPYNADHMDVPQSDERGGGTQKSTQKKYLADDDKRTDEEYREFLKANIELLLKHSHEVFYNIGVASGSKRAIVDILYIFKNKFKELLYWEKENPMPVIAEGVISSATELIIAFGNNNTRSFNHFNDRLFHGVVHGLSASTYNKYADIHKTTFPVYLPSEIIQRFTEQNGTVLDCFGGTGTTMIACEQLNRKCYMVELDPHYCDVIIERWENFTGEKAVLLND